ncbi:uncharacterized protein LOC131636428 [Vicia villosa]|uniref:uncharacterized protein LOC131636428 n=1 Tax=Vicia villosa TaxID=3911 RepID=UPI00273C4099|nr:uncharacterized protein LOC131636428 [Vicia villosa]
MTKSCTSWKKKRRYLFLYDYGGTGKSFMWNTLSAVLHSNRDIVLNFASRGIASLLLPGGKTTHSRFKIPVPCLESSICNIEKKTDLAGLLKVTNLIIWDEAPMANKFCFEALDKSLKDIMDDDKVASKIIFGGKVVVFGGDFRQILPVVPRAKFDDPIEMIVKSTYPNILENYTNSTFLQSRAILASTIEIVDEINDYIINLLPGDAKEFLSSDSIDRS